MIYTVYMWNNSERRDNQSGKRDNQSGRKQGSLYAARYIDGVEILGCDIVLRWYKRSPYWASQASPTLGCSIEISRDIYMYIFMCVCRGPKSARRITWPNTRLLKVSLGRLKQGKKC